VPLLVALGDPPAWLFADERIDTWVFKVALGIILASIVGLVLWHLVGYLAGRRPRNARKARQSPEPPAPIATPLPAPRARSQTPSAADDPVRLQEACTALEGSLAEAYLQLAESWLRRGQSQQAAAVWRKILQNFPGREQAQSAQARLQQMGDGIAEAPGSAEPR
jgi:hypothetical protein